VNVQTGILDYISAFHVFWHGCLLTHTNANMYAHTAAVGPISTALEEEEEDVRLTLEHVSLFVVGLDSWQFRVYR